MAANLTGMFQQLNQAVMNNPLATGQGQNLLDIASQGAGNVLSNMPGQSDPYSYMNQGAKMRQGQQDLGQLDLSTLEGMEKAATVYGKMGMAPQQASMAKQAAVEKQRQQQVQQEQRARELLAAKAAKFGLTEDAEALRTNSVTPEQLKEIDKKVRDEQLLNLAKSRNGPARRNIARAMGISEEEFDSAGLGGADPETFTDYVDGKNSSPKAYTDANGKPVILNTRDKNGKVKHPKTGKWVEVSELSLSPATQRVQQVLSAGDKLVEGMTDLAIEKFGELQEGAQDAAKTLEVTDRALNRLNDGTATGVFAPIEIALGRVADELGIDGEWARNARNAQAYAATMGNEVATVIKSFGSGTGLSDADREYALQIAAGDVKVDEAALRWLLNARRLAARNIKSKHTEVLNQLSEDGMDPSVFQILDITARPMNTVPSGNGGSTFVFDPSTGQLTQR